MVELIFTCPAGDPAIRVARSLIGERLSSSLNRYRTPQSAAAEGFEYGGHTYWVARTHGRRVRSVSEGIARTGPHRVTAEWQVGHSRGGEMLPPGHLRIRCSRDGSDDNYDGVRVLAVVDYLQARGSPVELRLTHEEFHRVWRSLQATP